MLSVVRSTIVSLFGAALAATGASPPAAAADLPPQARVALLEAPGSQAPESFLQMLKIQLRDVAEVESGPVLPDQPLPQKLEAAAAFLVGSGAALAVWLDTAPSDADADASGVYVVYAVGNKERRALIEVGRINRGDDPEVERAMAIKVGEMVTAALSDEFIGTAAPPPAQEVTTSPAQVSSAQEKPERMPFAASAAEPGRARVSLGLALGAVGALGAGNTGAQIGMDVAAGALFRGSASWSAEVWAALRTTSGLTAATANGRLSSGEITPGVAARVLRGLGAAGRHGVGLGGEITVRAIDARGTGTGGETGSGRVVLPALFGGIEGRVAFTRALSLRLAAGVDVALYRQRFSVNGAPVGDLGRARPLAHLALMMGL